MWSLGKARLRRSARPPARADNTANWSAKRPFTASWLSPPTTATIPVSLPKNARVSAVQPPWASHTSGRYWTPAARQSALARLCCLLRRAYWKHAVPPACRVSSHWLSPKAMSSAMGGCFVACCHRGAEPPMRLHLAPTRRQAVDDHPGFQLPRAVGGLGPAGNSQRSGPGRCCVRCMAALAVQGFATVHTHRLPSDFLL